MKSKIVPKTPTDASKEPPSLPKSHPAVYSFAQKFIEAVEAKPMKMHLINTLESCPRYLMQYVTDHLRVVGFKAVPFEASPELFDSKKEAAFDMLTKEPFDTDVENSEELQRDLARLHRALCHFVTSKDLTTAKKVEGESLLERWLKILEQVHDWLLLLSEFPREAIRRQNNKMTLHLIEEVLKNEFLLENDPFAERLESFVIDFVEGSLFDRELAVRLHTLDWLNLNLEKYDTLIAILVRDIDIARAIWMAVMGNLSRQTAEVRTAAVELIEKMMELWDPPTKEAFGVLIKEYRGLFVGAVLESTLKDADAMLRLVSRLQEEYRFLDAQSLTTCYLMVFSDNKLLARKFLEFFVQFSGFKEELGRKKFNQKSFLQFAAVCQEVVNGLPDKSKSSNLADLFEALNGLHPTEDLDVKVFGVVGHFLSQKSKSEDTTNSIGGLLKILMGLSRSKINQKAPVIFKEIKDGFEVSVAQAEFHNCLPGFLEMTFEVLKEQTPDDIETFVPTLGNILKEVPDIAASRITAKFLARFRTSVPLIDEVLFQGYEATRQRVQGVQLFEEPKPDILELVEKVNIFCQLYLETRQISKDFENLPQLLYNCLALNYEHVAPELVAALLTFRVMCVEQRVFVVVTHTDTEDIENDLVAPFQKDVLKDLEKALEFGATAQAYSALDIRKIQDAAFENLVTFYVHLSNDYQEEMEAVFFLPSSENGDKLLAYFDRLLGYHQVFVEEKTGLTGAAIRVEEDRKMEMDDDTVEFLREEHGAKVSAKVRAILDLLVSSKTFSTMGITHKFINKVFHFFTNEKILGTVSAFLVSVLEREGRGDEKASFFKLLYMCIHDNQFADPQIRSLCRIFTKALNQFGTMKGQHKPFQEKLDQLFFKLMLITIKEGVEKPRENANAVKAASFLVSKRRPTEKNQEETKNFVFHFLDLKRKLDMDSLNAEVKQAVHEISESVGLLLGLTKVKPLNATQRSDVPDPDKKPAEEKPPQTDKKKAPKKGRSRSRNLVVGSKAKLEDISVQLRQMRQESEEKHQKKLEKRTVESQKRARKKK